MVTIERRTQTGKHINEYAISDLETVIFHAIRNMTDNEEISIINPIPTDNWEYIDITKHVNHIDGYRCYIVDFPGGSETYFDFIDTFDRIYEFLETYL